MTLIFFTLQKNLKSKIGKKKSLTLLKKKTKKINYSFNFIKVLRKNHE